MFGTVIVALLLVGLPFRHTDWGMAAIYLATGLAALELVVLFGGIVFSVVFRKRGP